MIRIGIAGFMGAGKSAAARIIQSLGGAVIDADREAKSLMSSDRRIRDQLMREFGPAIVTGPEINFSVLGDLTFRSFDEMQKLNRVVHPLLIARLRQLMQSGGAAICALDAALIPLWGIEPWFDRLLWVRCPAQARLVRLRDKSPLSEDALRLRMSIQERLFAEPAGAPWHMVDNSGNLDDLRAAVNAWWAQISLPSEG
jgi:dephospho-CoA kinase